jgi:hypothetical protein
MPEGADTAVQFFGTGDLAFVAGNDPAAVRPFDLGASDTDLLAAARAPDADASLGAAVDAAHALCVATAPAAAAAGEEASSSDSDSDDAAAAANGDEDEALLLGELASGPDGEAKKAKKEKKDKKDKKEKKERKKEKKARKEEKEEKERRDKESRRGSGKNAATSSSSSSSAAAAAHSSSSIRRQRSEVLAGRVALTTEQLAEAAHIIDAAILGSPATADAIVIAELRKLAAAAPPTGAQLVASDCGSALGALLNPALSSRAPGGAAVLAPATVVLAEAVLRFWYAAGLTTKERYQLDRARPIADFGADDVVVLS